MSHIRKKTCVICSTKWTIEWSDDEPFREYITCPNCRYEKEPVAKD